MVPLYVFSLAYVSTEETTEKEAVLKIFIDSKKRPFPKFVAQNSV